MADLSDLLPSMQQAIQEQLGNHLERYLIPPPIFKTLGGKFLAFDPVQPSLVAKFPVLTEHLNPFGVLQGGIIAALADNTIGPLSILVAPPNVTRNLEITYSKPITPELKFIFISSRLAERNDPKLVFKASVRDSDGKILARVKSTHWIIHKEEDRYCLEP